MLIIPNVAIAIQSSMIFYSRSSHKNKSISTEIGKKEQNKKTTYNIDFIDNNNDDDYRHDIGLIYNNSITYHSNTLPLTITTVVLFLQSNSEMFQYRGKRPGLRRFTAASIK